MKIVPLLLLNLLAGISGQDEEPTAGALEAAEEPLSETCLQETQVLVEDESLIVAQSIIFEDYEASYKDVCSFGLADLGCSIKFEGDERTFEALCDAKGGQLYLRPVTLSCLLGTIDYDLGTIPTCVGGSCNVTNVRPGDVASEEVSDFLDNLTFVGCDAESAAYSTTGSAAGIVSLTMMSLWVVAMLL